MIRWCVMHLFRLSLRAFPASHRARYGTEMAAAFAEAWHQQRRAGLSPALRFALSAAADAVVAGIGQRRRTPKTNDARTGRFSRIDLLLAWRMLIRYPGLSAISVFGMAVGIAIALGTFTAVEVLTDVRLPFRDSDRIVSLLNRDVASNNRESRVLHDVAAWRVLGGIEDVGVARSVTRNLIASGIPEPVTIAEISSSAFRITGVDAIRGRYLLPEDEQPGAADVVVIGHDEWTRRFEGAPDIVGRTVQLGDTLHTIVGVMPNGYGFPISHSFWVPWRVAPSAFGPRQGPSVQVFGRLADGVTLESAQAELTVVGERASAALPETHTHLRPRVVPYAYVFNDLDDPDNALAMRAIQFALILLLTLIAVNVAILVYARTATRQAEIVVRGALGASRGRIVIQLCFEALMLAGVAGAAGVLLVSAALPWLESAVLAVTGGRLPFWMHFELSTLGMTYALGLTLAVAAIVGVLPALKITAVDVRVRLQALSAGGGSRMQMGRVWTTLIVAQVGITVALLPAALFYAWDGLRLRSGDSGFASREILTAALAMDRSLEAPSPSGDAAFVSQYAAAADALAGRLAEHASVHDVTFSAVPAGHELAMVLDAEGIDPPPDLVDYNIVDGTKAGRLVRYNRVSPNFLATYDVPVLLGRGFSKSDPGTDAVIINRTLAESVFGTTNPLGRRVRYVGRSREAIVDNVAMERWAEVVGVVADFPVNAAVPVARLYHPADLRALSPAVVAVRVRHMEAELFADELRSISAATHPNLQIRNISTGAMTVRREQGLFRLIGTTVGTAMISVIVLSAAGIYALMSFTVTRRRREIGIRAALGADRQRLLLGIFARVAAQLGGGAVFGLVLSFGLQAVLQEGALDAQQMVILPVVIAIMLLVGVLAAVGPARRGLAIQPIEALRDE